MAIQINYLPEIHRLGPRRKLYVIIVFIRFVPWSFVDQCHICLVLKTNQLMNNAIYSNFKLYSRLVEWNKVSSFIIVFSFLSAYNILTFCAIDLFPISLMFTKICKDLVMPFYSHVSTLNATNIHVTSLDFLFFA